MKLDWSHWFYTLLKTVIGGVAGAGSAWLGTLVGSQIDSDIHALDLRQMGFVLLSSTLLNLFFFLKQSPLPDDNDPPATPPMSRLPIILLTGLLAFGVMTSFTGCTTPQTREAVVFNSFKDAWTVAHSAYQAHCENVVRGKVSAEKEAKVDEAWNKFRLVFKASLAVAHQDWSKPAPATLDAAERQLLILIRTL